MKWIIIRAGNVLSPKRPQAITCTNDDVSTNGPLETNLKEIWIEIQYKNEYQIMVYMMAAILCKPHCVKTRTL